MAVPPIVHAEHRVTRALQRAGAASPGSALPLGELRRIDRRALQRLTAAGAVVAAGDGRYWVDAEAYRGYRAERRRRAILAVIVMLIILAALGGIGVIGR
jgi:hypothetical protein